jgi:class 3 adenylate cyclase
MCTRVDAARDVARRIAAVNAERRTCRPFDYGIGLHVGDVTYGNIGIPQRLQFTVIGPAANEASRIESMTKALAEPVLFSQRFAQCYRGQLETRGAHELRGVGGTHELFALPAAPAAEPIAPAG